MLSKIVAIQIDGCYFIGIQSEFYYKYNFIESRYTILHKFILNGKRHQVANVINFSMFNYRFSYLYKAKTQ